MQTIHRQIRNLIHSTIGVFDEDHQRKRRFWGPRATFLGLLLLVGSRMRFGYQDMIEYVFEHWSETLQWERKPAISGFSKARSSITPEQCRDAWKQAVAIVESAMPQKRYPREPGGRVACIDGSWVVAPSTAGTRKRWGRIKGKKGNGETQNPQALVVTAWELRSRMPIGFSVLNENEGERVGAHRVIDELQAGDVALMDRGFPSERILGQLNDKKVDFVIRMPTARQSCWREVREFMKSKDTDKVMPVEITDPDGTTRMVKLRLIKRTFEPGRPKKGQSREEMVLVTTLMDRRRWRASDIVELYQKRWAVETAYKEMKVDFGVEEFHSVTPERIEQEMYALLTWLTLMAFIEIKAEEELEELRGPQKLNDPERYLISRPSLHLITLWTFCDLIAGGEQWEARKKKLQTSFKHLAAGARKKRPNRSSPRSRSRPFGRYRNPTK